MRITKLALVGWLILIMLLVSTAIPTLAQQQSAIQVQASNAIPDFPTSINFTLSASSNMAEITEVQLLYGLQREDSRTLVDAQFIPGEQIAAQHVLDTQVFHIPPGVEVAYSWIIRDEAGNEIASEEQTLFYADTRFDWQQRSLGMVTVYWYEGGESFGDALVDTAKTALDNLQRDISAEVEEPIAIYIYANTRDMRAALQSNEVEWVGGQARPSIGLIIGAIAPGDTNEIVRIIPHELSHQVLYQATNNPYGGVPLWFEEGLAVHSQEIQLDYHKILLEEAARNDDLIPVEALAASFPTDSERASLSYAESHSLVEFILEEYGTEAMHNLVMAFQAAMPLDEALLETLGMTVDELDAAWRETLPAAVGTIAATPTPQTTAPDSRFANEPVLPEMVDVDTIPTDTPQAGVDVPDAPGDDDSSLIPGSTLPLWAELALGAGFCIVMVTMLAVGLIVLLRVVGVDKRQ